MLINIKKKTSLKIVLTFKKKPTTKTKTLIAQVFTSSTTIFTKKSASARIYMERFVNLVTFVVKLVSSLISEW